MERNEIRGALAKRLRLDDVPDPLWGELEEDGEVRAAVHGGPDDFETLVSAGKRALKRHSKYEEWKRGRQPTGVTRRATPDPGPYVLERARAWDEAVALWTARDERVRRFREVILGGAALDVPLARRLLDSAAARVWARGDFDDRGVPLVGHRGRVLNNREFVKDGWLRQEIDVRVTWDGGALDATASRRWLLGASTPDPILTIVDERGERTEDDVWPGSVLDRLRGVGEHLARFYGLDPAEAAWFVLIDAPPRRDPVAGTISVRTYQTHEDGRVTLSVDPWVPADVVLEAYRAAQRDLLGRENRQLALRNLRAFRLVLAGEREAARLGRRHPTRAEAMARWNAEHPDEPYRQEWMFNRDVERAERAVLFPDYRLGMDNMDEEGGA
jgi:hypothetical protein